MKSFGFKYLEIYPFRDRIRFRRNKVKSNPTDDEILTLIVHASFPRLSCIILSEKYLYVLPFLNRTQWQIVSKVLFFHWMLFRFPILEILYVIVIVKTNFNSLFYFLFIFTKQLERQYFFFTSTENYLNILLIDTIY